jgi:two-component sensor histidine kinase
MTAEFVPPRLTGLAQRVFGLWHSRRRYPGGTPLVINDVMTDARTAFNPESLLKLSVRALLNIVVLEHGRPVAILFAHFGRPASWSPEVLRFLRNVAERVQIGIARLKAEEQQCILNHELSHRMKNTLMMVQAIAGQTLKDVADRDTVKEFSDRVHALSTAHEVLLKTSWVNADLREVIQNVTSRIESQNRFDMSGPPLVIGPRAALSLSLLLHEISTNRSSMVRTQLQMDVWLCRGASMAARMNLSYWNEHGGPPVQPPVRRGFGSRLIAMGLVGTGGVELRYLATGFEATF